MKFIFLVLLISITQICYSQITFEEVLSFEKKPFKEIQSALFVNYTNIKDYKMYSYLPLKKCNPPEYAKDSCQWSCSESDYSDEVESKYPISNVSFKKNSNKYYETRLAQESDFADNYNSVTKKATTFIYVSELKKWGNDNCQNEMRVKEGLPISIEIQFANPDEWKDFKSSVTKNATFLDTYQIMKDSPVQFRYGILRTKTDSGKWKGILISLYETMPTFHAIIKFDVFGVE